MPEPLVDALAALRPLLLDADALVRAVAAGHRRGQQPSWPRVTLRPVDLKDGRRLQVVTEEPAGPRTRNEAYDGAGAPAATPAAGAGAPAATTEAYDGAGAPAATPAAYDGAGAPAATTAAGAAAVVDALLAEPFGNWHVQTTTETVQLRVTKKGAAQVNRSVAAATQHTGHDRAAAHLIDPGDPLFTVLGAGASKRRQVDAFLHMLAGVLDDAPVPRHEPLRVVDLGCGNAYLTFAAYRFLSERREVEVLGIDRRAQARDRNNALAERLGWASAMRFEERLIGDTARDAAGDTARDAAGDTARDAAGDTARDTTGSRGDVVLSLHACDTATDDALAQAVRWRAAAILASPCCHHDLQRQLRRAPTPAPYQLLTRHAILRERFGDVLTDALRVALLRRAGYRADVVAFVAAEYTPRNTMIRAVRRGTGAPAGPADAAAEPGGQEAAEYDALVREWGVTPYLQTLLADGPG